MPYKFDPFTGNLHEVSAVGTAIAAGTAGAPSISFAGDTNTGIYSPGADQLAVVTNGIARLTANTTAISSSLAIDHPLGAEATPSITFTGDLNTGFYSPAADTLAVVTAGSNRLHITSGGAIGIGTNSPNYQLHATTSFAVGASGFNQQLTFTNSTVQSLHLGVGYSTLNLNTLGGSVVVGTVAAPVYQFQVATDSAGKPSSALWTIVSDERIKEDIELADLDLCYQAIKAIPLKRYKWRDEIYTTEQVADRRKLGWIAQDVKTVFPKAVGTYKFKYNQVFEETIIPAVKEKLDADGNVITPAQPERTERGNLISENVIEDCHDLNADQIYAAMYGAVQKLMAKVETLETEVALLKGA